jgi:2',3'-cyclic-nucleotide 2'-phosphodiesterase (5'-nucleotidase family)
MQSVSFFNCELKYIFFLLFLIIFSYTRNSFTQSIKSVDHSSNESNQSIGEILFLANINGVIENCKCGKPPLGGLPQISTIIDEHIKKNKYAYFIDGGDFLNTYPYPLLNSAVIDIYNLLNVKFLTLGDQERIDTNEIDRKLIMKLKDKIIASNYRIENFDFKSYGQLELRNGIKAYILSYLDKKSFFVSEDKKNIQFDDPFFSSTYYDLSKKNSLIVLIFHGTKYTLNAIIEKFSKINLILWAHEQSNIEDITKNPVIIGGGSDGEYIKQIDIYKEIDHFKFKLISIPVSANIQENPKINMIIDKFKLADKAAKIQK